ncbi:MAG: crossover junction endodeoxyribonuclease RuvC [Candidatus Magasanikbacteria bacterium CG10_big_fil_rev_8_21_14_0_10_40_10]|uniref:Crossover junction endodeoxyribonuclease RuvC n=1 Tax=Candidatus Magasanikbacteria bacterium CG10_big_fil_rev_8_21_14_0_10_40_10 TaxID=1974648 RepID=A0A2M6W3X2_9BACT|nr:MAG: crossover junction endodeoxyribonuclease RuvC [Candidatus Magasanikbacteria bacterium CG10_big_fil_rev_8_21_14_0_10_40_10]
MPVTKKTKEIILGIDPGFGRVGWGVIIQNGSDWQAVNYGCIETFATDSFVDRLVELYEAIKKIIKKYQPTRMAVEDLFFFKNLKTAVKVGQARGAILLAGARNGLEVDEFTPLQVKQALTGYGRAEKGQMQKMVQAVLKLKQPIKSDDAADALAVALCAGQSLWVKRVSDK